MLKNTQRLENLFSLSALSLFAALAVSTFPNPARAQDDSTAAADGTTTTQSGASVTTAEVEDDDDDASDDSDKFDPDGSSTTTAWNSGWSGSTGESPYINVQCSAPNGGHPGFPGDWSGAPGWSGGPGFWPGGTQCHINGVVGSYADFYCFCEDGEGEKGVLDIEWDLNDPWNQMYRICQDKVKSVCGDYRTPVHQECRNDYGNCSVRLSGREGDEPYTRLDIGCNCLDGSQWNINERADNSEAWPEDEVRSACREELSLCRAPQQGGQGSSISVSQDEDYSVSTNCRSNYGNCYFNRDSDPNTSETYHCSCFDGTSEYGSLGSANASASGEELLADCFEWVEMCQKSADPDNTPVPDDQDDQDDQGEQNEGDNAEDNNGLSTEDLVNLADALGCSVQGDAQPLSWALFLLMGAGFMRRRQQ